MRDRSTFGVKLGFLAAWFGLACAGSLTAAGPVPGEPWDIELGGQSYRFQWIPAGSFVMGSPAAEEGRQGDERPHEVILTEGFWMGQTEVTQALWQAVMGTNPSHFADAPQRPIDSVSWFDAVAFCEQATVRLRQAALLEESWAVDLPSEVQWEYACRAGTSGVFAGPLEELAWYLDTSGESTHEVAQLEPNAWGLFDLHGNVWEWCLDPNADYPEATVTDPEPPAFGAQRIIRGGAWYLPARYLRSANRFAYLPDYRDNGTGFRLVLRAERE